MGAVGGQAAGDGVTDAPGGSGEQDAAAGELHDPSFSRRAILRGVAGTVIALFGPTAVGKTAVALALAERLRERGERPAAVSADALQVYAGLGRLTGAATRAERARLEHRLVGFLPVDARFSVGEYAELAHAEIDGLLGAGRRPLVVGGTGLYLRAALADLDLRPPPAAGIREALERELAAGGPAALHARLALRDPVAAARIDPADHRRVVRALELLASGETPPPVEDSQLWTARTRHPTLLIALTMERDALNRRIDARVDAILAAGAVDEVRRAHGAGASETARQALGFDELLAGDVGALKRRTRLLAKRQLTWLRKLAGAEAIDVTGLAPAEVSDGVMGLLDRRERTEPAPGQLGLG